MISHLLKIIWKRRKSGRVLLIEFLGSFLILTLVIIFSVIYTTNYLTPLGFEYENRWVVSFLPADSQDTSEEERFSYKWTKINRKAKHYLLNRNDVIAVAEAPKQNRPFLSERGWFNVQVKKQIFPDCLLSYVDDDYADLMNLNIIKGRWFSSEDNSSRIRPAVVNLAFAQLVFKKDYPIGEVFQDQDKTECKIVGIIDQYRYKGDFSDNKPIYFARCTEHEGLLYNNHTNGNLWNNTMYEGYSPMQADLIIKVNKNAGPNFEAFLYNQLIGRYKNTALKIRPLGEYRKTHIQNTLLPFLLMGLVLGFLIFNSISGLFGVLWYNISLRKSEIGLRMAVGASKRSIYKQFIGEMLVLATLGIIPGLIIVAQFPILKVFDIETKIYIIAMLAATLLIYLLVTLCAILPSAQAAKIQPAVALHEE